MLGHPVEKAVMALARVSGRMLGRLSCVILPPR